MPAGCRRYLCYLQLLLISSCSSANRKMQTSPEKALMTEAARPEPSRVYRWIVLFVVSLTMFGNYYVYDCIAPIADVLVKQLVFSAASIRLLQPSRSPPDVS